MDADDQDADDQTADDQTADDQTVRQAWGDGLATVTAAGEVLDTWYPSPALGDRPSGAPASELAAAARSDDRRRVDVRVVRTGIDLDAPPADAPDAYLRLHLLSHRLVAPHGLNLTGLFGVLTTVAWTSLGPVGVADVAAVALAARSSGAGFSVFGVDKFPRMTDYVVPSGVRIADADRVRLGAHLAPGTTVMHEGFVNFNAGTLGASMVEGRISAGVVVGAGTDIGGGASIMGTLSGGGAETIRVGAGCLIGANGGIGISLGDECVVEAGCYVTAGTLVTLDDGRTVKAAQLSGRPGLLYRRHSTTGRIEALPRAAKWQALNAELHAND